jgi:hypothetical protein
MVYFVDVRVGVSLCVEGVGERHGCGVIKYSAVYSLAQLTIPFRSSATFASTPSKPTTAVGRRLFSICMFIHPAELTEKISTEKLTSG